jgi:integrase
MINAYKDGLPSPRLEELWNAFYQDKVTRNSWRKRTEEKYVAAFNVVLDILGNLELSRCGSDTWLRLTQGLKKYPSNKNKYKQFMGKPFDPAMSTMPGFEELSTDSINFHIGLISGMFQFALEDRRRWRIDQNPFSKKQVKETHVKAPNELRRDFTRKEIEEIFVELSKVRRLVEPEKFWVPLICLYSGMRINEACQLRTDDIEFIDDIPVFQIQHRPQLFQETKNGKSRTVPIHKTLEKIGFIDFFKDQRKKKEERLFPRLELYKGKWHRKVDNWFNRTVLRSHMNKDDNVSFHSTKHTFINWYQQTVSMDVTQLKILKNIAAHYDNRELSDKHIDGGITTGRYGKNYLIKISYDFINLLDYKVDLSLLSKK